MANFTFKGTPCTTNGDLPAVGVAAPALGLTKLDLSELSLDDLKGKKVVLNIFPSIDTGVCATSVRTFNEKAAGLDNTAVVCVSRDLPFAMNRFCGAEGIENVQSASDFRTGSFGENYGVVIQDGPLASLLARSVVCLDEQGNVTYTELVGETVDEPNYDAALAAVS